MREVVVDMLIGSYIIDPVATLAPQLRVKSPRAACNVAAVLAVSATTWRSATGGGDWKPQVNHYVIGVRVQGSSDPDVLHELPVSSDTAAMCACKTAMYVGWLLKETHARGDCGVDCMAYYDDVDRSEASWRKIRREIYMFMNSVKHIPTWQGRGAISLKSYCSCLTSFSWVGAGS